MTSAKFVGETCARVKLKITVYEDTPFNSNFKEIQYSPLNFKCVKMLFEIKDSKLCYSITDLTPNERFLTIVLLGLYICF